MVGDMKPSPDQPAILDAFRLPLELIRDLVAFQHEHKMVRMTEAFRALVELRRQHAGFARRLVVTVLVPQCEDCYANERYKFRADESTWRPPDIMAPTWRKDLRMFGVTERELRRIYRDRRNPFIEVPRVRCKSCGEGISYGEENVYVSIRPFENVFPELLGSENSDPPIDTPQFVKKLVYWAYDRKCAGCATELTWSEKTMDHIRPKHVGGPGTLENIQLACRRCQKAKGGTEPTEVHLRLDFPLMPPGPEFSEMQRLVDL